VVHAAALPWEKDLCMSWLDMGWRVRKVTRPQTNQQARPAAHHSHWLCACASQAVGSITHRTLFWCSRVRALSQGFGVWGRCYFQSIEGTRERGERAGAAGDQTRETLRHEVEACTSSWRRAFETRISVHPRLTHLELIASTTSTAGMKRPGSREPPPRRWS
jgi:hypothetical protein